MEINKLCEGRGDCKTNRNKLNDKKIQHEIKSTNKIKWHLKFI